MDELGVDGIKKDDGELIELERNLREGLQRVAAPLGFEARVMVAAVGRERRRRWARMRAGWAVAAVLLLAGAGGAVEYQHMEYERKAAVAQEQVGLALHIAAQKLDLVRHELNEKGDAR